MINDTAIIGTYPPLTPDDIYILCGKPAAKNVLPAGPKTQSREEWIYYHADAKTQEHYVFRGGRLVGWTKSKSPESKSLKSGVNGRECKMKNEYQ